MKTKPTQQFKVGQRVVFRGAGGVVTMTKEERRKRKPRCAMFERFDITMPQEAVNDMSQPGDAGDAVDFWKYHIPRPDDCTPERLAAELKEYGAWDAEELSDDDRNWERIIWIGACNIKEDHHGRRRR